MSARPSLRKAVGTDPTANGLSAEAAVACDLPLRGALPNLFRDRFIASQAALSVLLLHTLFTRYRRGRGWLLRDRCNCRFRSSAYGLRHLSQQTRLWNERAQEILAHVVK